MLFLNPLIFETIVQVGKYLLSDDSSHASGSYETGQRAEQQAREDRQQQERQRLQQQERQQQRQVQRQSVDQALRSLCAQFDLATAPLTELPHAPSRGEQQLQQALAQQAAQAQSPHQQRLSALERALWLLDKLA